MIYYISFKIFIYLSLIFVVSKDFSHKYVDMAQLAMIILIGITGTMVLIDLMLNVVSL